MTDTPAASAAPRWAGPAIVVGLVLHLAVAVFPLSASGLVAPAWAIAGLYGLWALLGVGAWRARHDRPWALGAAALLTVVLWAVALTLGEQLLGWTA